MQSFESGFYTKDDPNPDSVDWTIIEATYILPNGGIVLGTGVGSTIEFASVAEKIIIEVNTAIPPLQGLHDLISCGMPPHRKPIMIDSVDSRVGLTYVPIDPEKIFAIVESTELDNGRPLASPDAQSKKIAGKILDFFHHEVNAGRLPEHLLPLQSGVGNIANAVMGNLAESDFEGLTAYSEIFQVCVCRVCVVYVCLHCRM